MTLPELHIEVEVKFELLAAQTLDNFLPQEIDLYVNRAIRKFISQHRPLLLSEGENAKTRKATENLRTLLNTHTYQSGDFSSVSNMTGVHSLPIGNLTPSYEYFVRGRLITDTPTEYTVETTTIPDLYEHIETRHNKPFFRRGKIAERNDKFILAVPDSSETPDKLEVTYVGAFSRVSSELAVEYTVTSGGGGQTATIDIEGVSYNIPWNTDAATTIDDFITNHKDTINDRHNVVARDLDSKIEFITYNPNVLESEFAKDDSSADTSLSKSVTTSRPEIPLPDNTHETLVDLTVQLMRNDLPQAKSGSEEE